MNYYGFEVLAGMGHRPATLCADLAIVTVAALADAHLDVSVCDESLTPADLDTRAGIIGITGKLSQHRRMVELAAAYRERGKVVVMGGPFATLSPHLLREHCDVLVHGEIETIADELFGDLRAGRAKDEYFGGRPELTTSPVPRWDLYLNERAINGTVQTARGCPFACEFCDVIQYNGRKQRFKTTDQVLTELDALYARGYRSAMVADDNFTVNRGRAKTLLAAIRAWNLGLKDGKMRFATQASVDLADDEDLMVLCAEAGFTNLFVGIETPVAASLQTVNKRQNVGRDLRADLEKILAHGISVAGGMIVGFDTDDSDTFQRQLDFAMASGVPIFACGALMAPDQTPLRDRLAEAGRLRSADHGGGGNPFTTNIIHPTLSTDELLGGLKWLVNQLYNPTAFGARMKKYIDQLGDRRDPDFFAPMRFIDNRRVLREAAQVVSRHADLGEEERRLITEVLALVENKPSVRMFVWETMITYMQVRYSLERGGLWEPGCPPYSEQAASAAS